MTEHERIEREVQEGVCEFMHVHQEIVDSVEKALPDEQQLLDLSEFFKVFGDSTRIKILYVLSQSEMCLRYRHTAADGTVRYLPSASGAETDEAGKVSERWKDGILLLIR